MLDPPKFFKKYMLKGAAGKASTSAESGSSTSALDSFFENVPASDMQPQVMLPAVTSTSQQTVTSRSTVQQSADALLGIRQPFADVHDDFFVPTATPTLQSSAEQSLPVFQGPSQLHCSAQAQLIAPAWSRMQPTAQHELPTISAVMQAQGPAVQPFSAAAAAAAAALHPAAHSLQLSHTHASHHQAAARFSHSACETFGQQVDTSTVDLQLLSDLDNRSVAMGPSPLTVQVTRASSNRSAAFEQKLVRQPLSPGTPDQSDVSVRSRRRVVVVRNSNSEAMAASNLGGMAQRDVIDLTEDDGMSDTAELMDAAEMGSAQHSMRDSMEPGQVATGRSRGRKRGREHSTEHEEAPPAKKIELSSLEDQELVWAQYLNWPHWPAKVGFQDCLNDLCCACLCVHWLGASTVLIAMSCLCESDNCA